MSHFRYLVLGACGVIALGSAVLAIPQPASAVGSNGWNCAIYTTFSGSSTRRSSSTTSSPPQCGNAKIQVVYTVSGGGKQKTPWRTAANVVIQPGVGYDVYQGNHAVTNAAPAYDMVQST
jgi:hypothetical protein